MNIYRVKFYARCPQDGCSIQYALTIHTGRVILAEDIITATEEIAEGMHEAIADRLVDALGGNQVLMATHQGVEIETIRPSIAHWHKPAVSER